MFRCSAACRKVYAMARLVCQLQYDRPQTAQTLQVAFVGHFNVSIGWDGITTFNVAAGVAKVNHANIELRHQLA